MSGDNARRFEDVPATRERVPLFVGIVGPSGSGKTYSALRVAEGIRSVRGGETFVIDTEAKRSLHYADRFRFRHVAFGAPFGPGDYLAAVEHCASKGASVIVIDSVSHEHEGPGGVLEMHERETTRIAAAWKTSAERAKMAAWTRPKQERRRFINALLQLPISFVLCFRAKEKLRIERGRDPVPLGFCAIGAEELLYEMSLSVLLHPGARGVPTWESAEIGEREQIKLASWAEPLIRRGEPLDETLGAELARWAEGAARRDALALLDAFERCQTPAELGPLEAERRAIWQTTGAAQKTALRAAAEAARERVKRATTEQPIELPADNAGEAEGA